MKQQRILFIGKGKISEVLKQIRQAQKEQRKS